ncbi:hypothetical protein D3C72_1760380 [compost metagenome]
MGQLLPEQPHSEVPQASAVGSAEDTSGAAHVHAPAAHVAAATQAAVRPLRIQEIEISAREDVQVLLEKACEFLERTEPSHPAPMLIRRAQRLMDLNFFQIIEELVPEGLQKIESLAGRPLNGDAALP